jgi:hypothetical protein
MRIFALKRYVVKRDRRKLQIDELRREKITEKMHKHL